MTATSIHQSSALSAERRRVRVGSSTYVVVGVASALPVFAGIGLLAEAMAVFGVLCFVLAFVVFAHFCLQTIDVDGGVMTLRRPFFPTRRVLLSSVTQVRTVWSEDFYRRFLFLGGETIFCAFNPKLFELADLAFILAQVRLHSPTASFDEDTSAFLPQQT